MFFCIIASEVSLMKITKEKIWEWTKRLTVYVLGLFICAIGVNVAIASNLGVSPNNSLPLVISNKFTALTLGNWVTIVYVMLVLLQIILMGKNFKWCDIFQLAVSLAFGVFVDAAKWLCDACLPPITLYPVRLLCILISTFLIALGLCLYMDTKIIMLPVEGFSSALAYRLKRPFTTCKIATDVIVTCISVTLSLVWFHRFVGIREGTAVIAVGVGFVMKLINKWTQEPIERFLFGKREKSPLPQTENEK